MKMRYSSLLFLSVLIILLHACQVSNTAEQVSVVSPPFSKVRLVPESFVVNTQRDTLLTTKKGSTIHIPAGSIVDATGVSIVERVDVSFTEYHTREDIILSGIPMHYSEAGDDGYLVTAGMCTITASYAGAEVFIAPEKAVHVELASEYRGEEVVDFFELDENTGEWTKTGEPTAIENPARAAINSQLAVLENTAVPAVPRALDPNEPVLNFNETGEGLQQVGLEYSVWRYAGNSQKDNPLYKDAFTNNGYRLQRTERLFSETGMIRAYFEMGAYNEKDSFDVHDTLAVLLMPVVFGNALNKAQEAYQTALKAYNDRQVELARLRAEMNSISRYRYGFQVRGWGTFNCDVFMRNAFVVYNVRIKMFGKILPEGKISLLMSNARESGVINYSYSDGAPLRIFTESECIMTIVANDQLSIVKDIFNNPNVKIDGNEMTIKALESVSVENETELSNALAEL